MRVQVTTRLDMDALKEAAVEAIADALETADPGSIGGVGADGTSEYETTDWTVEYDADKQQFVLNVEVERLEGKFAARDEILDEVQEIVSGASGDIAVTDFLDIA